jgi:hypothetical protein
MPVASIIPNGQVILSPFEAYLCIVVLGHEIDKVRE